MTYSLVNLIIMRKFGLDFADQEELDCYLIDLALLRVGEKENNPHPELYPRYKNPELSKRFTRSAVTWNKISAIKPQPTKDMSDF